MRSVLRYLFLAVMVMALAAFGSGTAFATSIGTPSAASVAAVTPSAGQEVGIAHPVTIQFTAAVADRARAERAIDITSTRSIPGTFAWANDREVTWTPTGFLPTRSPISVRIGSARTEFRTNAGVIADADMSNHTFTVTIGGQWPRTMPASMGKPGYETPTGIFPILEIFRSVVFDSRTIGIPLSSPRVTSSTVNMPNASRGVEFSCTRHPGRWIPRAMRTSATAASTSHPTTPPGTTKSPASATRSACTGRPTALPRLLTTIPPKRTAGNERGAGCPCVSSTFEHRATIRAD